MNKNTGLQVLMVLVIIIISLWFYLKYFTNNFEDVKESSVIEKIDEKLGQYSLITSLVDTDKGSIEMVYLEGYHGENPLESSKDFLVSTLGISGLILRSIIALESASKTD